MAWETFDMTSDKQEMDDMTADTTTPIAPSGGTQSLAGSSTYDAYANTQMGRLSRIVALHAGVSEPSTSQMLAERLGESARGVAVTSDYHVLRTAALARDVGLDVQVAPAHTALYFRISAFLREFVAMLARHRLANLVALAVVCLPLPLIMIWGLLLHG